MFNFQKIKQTNQNVQTNQNAQINPRMQRQVYAQLIYQNQN